MLIIYFAPALIYFLKMRLYITLMPGSFLKGLLPATTVSKVFRGTGGRRTAIIIVAGYAILLKLIEQEYLLQQLKFMIITKK